jgi:hypothetical protein
MAIPEREQLLPGCSCYFPDYCSRFICFLKPFTPFFQTVKKFLIKYCFWFVKEPGATTTMADFVQKANIKSAIRTLAAPIIELASLDATVQLVISITNIQV